MPSLYQRLKTILQRGKLERDLQDELRSHLEMDKQQRMDLGEEAEEAARQARRDFGNFLRPSEDVREAWGTAAIDRLSQDLRYALRQMKRNPGFVMVAVLTLGLG